MLNYVTDEVIAFSQGNGGDDFEEYDYNEDWDNWPAYDQFEMFK